MKIEGHPIDFMVDTGAKNSVVTQTVGPLSQKHITIIGATGDQTRCPFLLSRQCNIGSHEVRHEFIYLPDCSIGLMGRDLLCKLGHR
jgi:predicted aspartyl protease